MVNTSKGFHREKKTPTVGNLHKKKMFTIHPVSVKPDVCTHIALFAFFGCANEMLPMLMEARKRTSQTMHQISD